MSILGDIIRAITVMIEGPVNSVDQAAKLDAMAAKNPERLDWRNSIVDLMKLAGMDSSLQAREALANELGYSGELNGSADMNIWLHARVLERLR